MDGRKARSRDPGLPGFRPILLAALLFLAPIPSPAAGPPPVDFALLVGFSGSVRPGRFAPLVVTVSTGGQELEVRIEAEVSRRSGMGGTAAWQTLARTVTVPRSGSVRAGFALPVPRDPRGLEVRILRAGTAAQQAGQAQPGALLASRTVDLRAASAPGGLVVAVSSELAFDGLPLRPGPDGPGRISYPHPENLPDAWAAYDCVDTVVLRDTAGLRLRPAQVTALREWVFAGGTLVVSGGAPALLLGVPGLRELLPVQVTGLLDSVGLAPLAAALGVRRGPAGPVTLAASTPRGGAGTADIVTADGVPLVVSRPLGSGVVVFTAFDWAQPSLASWEGLGRLWDRVAGSGRQPLLDEDGPALPAEPWMKPLLASPQLSFPSTLAVLAFAAGCAAIFALLALGAVRLPALGRALALTAVALAAGAAGFVLFNRAAFDPRRILADAARVDAVSGQGLALVTEKLGFLTASVREPGPKEGPEAAARTDLGAVASSVSPGLSLAVEDLDGRGQVSVHGPPGSRFGGGLVVLTDVVDFPLDASLVTGADSLTLAVANGTPWELRGAFLARAGRAHPVGTLLPGARLALRLDPRAAVPFPPADDGLEPAPDALSADFLAQALPAEDRERTILVGWLDRSPLGARRDGAGLPAGKPARLLPGSRALVVLELR